MVRMRLIGTCLQPRRADEATEDAFYLGVHSLRSDLLIVPGDWKARHPPVNTTRVTFEQTG